MREIGPTSKAVYQFIIDYKATNDGNSPTRREISKGVDRVLSSVHYHLIKLERAGLIVTGLGENRNISIPGAKWTPPEVNQ